MKTLLDLSFNNDLTALSWETRSRFTFLPIKEDRQLIAIREFGIPDGNYYTDKQSGKDFNRPAYKQLMKKLKSGDILIVKSEVAPAT